MKYYIYISDTKVDMLLSQISETEEGKKAWELKIDLKVASILRKSENEGKESSIVRLNKVRDFILKFGNVGSIDAPDEYVSGTLNMRWRTLKTSDEPAQFVYFGGFTQNTVVGLVGSRKHLLGRVPNPDKGSISVDSVDGAASIDIDCYIDNVVEEINADGLRMLNPEPYYLLADQWIKGEYIPGQYSFTQRLEFLAKRLLYGNHNNYKVLVATPLYVALAD